MTLLMTMIAAVIATYVWYTHEQRKEFALDVPVWMFWGATLMWSVDAITEYSEFGAEYFTPAVEDMINDSFLGLSVIAFGLVVWIATLIIKDPNGVIRKQLKNNA